MSLPALAGLIYFHPLAGIWLLVLSLLFLWRVDVAAAVFFVAVSIDPVEPVVGGIFVSLSELELAAAILALLAREDRRRLDWRPLIWGLPLAAAVFLSALATIEWYKIIPHTLRVCELIAACFLALNAFRCRNSSRWIQAALAAACLFYVSHGLLQMPTAFRNRISSLFDNPNQFAGYVGLLLPFLLGRFLATPRMRIRLFWAYLWVLAALGLAASASRMAWAAAAVSTALMLFLHLRPRIGAWTRSPATAALGYLKPRLRLLAIHAALAAAALTLLLTQTNAPSVIERSLQSFSGRLQGGVAFSFFRYRTPYLQTGWKVWRENPLFGTGPGRWEEEVDLLLKSWSPDVNPRDREHYEWIVRVHCHSLYLHLAAVYGFPALAAFLFWFQRVWAALARGSGAWRLSGMGLIAAYLTHNLLDVTFPSLGIEAGILIGLSLSAQRRRVEGDGGDQ